MSYFRRQKFCQIMTSIDGNFIILSPTIISKIRSDPEFTFFQNEEVIIHRLERHVIKLYAPEGNKILYRWIL